MRLARASLALMLVTVPAWAPAAAAQRPDAEAQSGGEEQQILVMLRMSPAHYRPNSAYGGGYGDFASRAARARMARGIAQSEGLQLREGWPMPLLAVDCFLMVVPAGKSIDEIIGRVSKRRGVAWSQRVTSYAMRDRPQASNDPLYPIQPTATEWKLNELQRVATGRGVKIAIVDSKVDVRHPDLSGQVSVDRNFVSSDAAGPEAHGTHVAGIIGAKAGNGIGVAGVAPGAKLMTLRACSETDRGRQTLCQSLALAKAVQFAIENKANVINLSLSGPNDMLLGKLLEIAVGHGITVVAAFDQKLPGGGFPASLNGVIPVVDEALQATPKGVLRAPGRGLPTTQPGGGWGLVNGTSYAVAQVSGLAALTGQRGRGPFASKLVRANDGKIDACATVLGGRSRCP